MDFVRLFDCGEPRFLCTLRKAGTLTLCFSLSPTHRTEGGTAVANTSVISELARLLYTPMFDNSMLGTAHCKKIGHAIVLLYCMWSGVLLLSTPDGIYTCRSGDKTNGIYYSSIYVTPARNLLMPNCDQHQHRRARSRNRGRRCDANLVSSTLEWEGSAEAERDPVGGALDPGNH